MLLKPAFVAHNFDPFNLVSILVLYFNSLISIFYCFLIDSSLFWNICSKHILRTVSLNWSNVKFKLCRRTNTSKLNQWLLILNHCFYSVDAAWSHFPLYFKTLRSMHIKVHTQTHTHLFKHLFRSKLFKFCRDETNKYTELNKYYILYHLVLSSYSYVKYLLPQFLN